MVITISRRKRMKRFILCIFITLFSVIGVYAQMCYSSTTFNAEKNRLLEIARQGKMPNGCGAAGTPEALVNILNWLGDGGACDQHDKDYSTLGMSKSQADYNFKKNLQAAGVPDYLVTIFYNAVVYGGQDAYDSAQKNAKRFQELESDPSSRNYSLPSDWWMYN